MEDARPRSILLRDGACILSVPDMNAGQLN